MAILFVRVCSFASYQYACNSNMCDMLGVFFFLTVGSTIFFSPVSGVLQACMGMLRLVRAFTGREKIIKFDGCYHGHADGFLVQAGSGVATLGLPDSPGEIWRRLLSDSARIWHLQWCAIFPVSCWLANYN